MPEGARAGFLSSVSVLHLFAIILVKHTALIVVLIQAKQYNGIMTKCSCTPELLVLKKHRCLI